MLKAMILERKEITRKLKSVSIILIGKVHVIKKDGNRLGKRKYNKYLALHYRRFQLKFDINSSYGLKSSESNMILRFQKVDYLPALAAVRLS